MRNGGHGKIIYRTRPRQNIENDGKKLAKSVEVIWTIAIGCFPEKRITSYITLNTLINYLEY